ncbi:MAG: DUF167 domain-containing protein [Solirubrobacteraceae bacterium]
MVDGIEITVRLTPKAKSEEIVGVRDGVLLVKVAKPAVDGKANSALCRLLAKRLRVATGRVTVVSGVSSRVKRVRVEGIDAVRLREAVGVP